MSKIGERLTSEGADESFIVKTFADGRKSRVMNDASKNGLVHYNFNSESGYGTISFYCKHVRNNGQELIQKLVH